jgi:hydrogenase-4 component E
VISAAGLQGVLLGLLLTFFHAGFEAAAIIIAILTLLIKGFFIPALLRRAMRDLQIQRESEPFLGYTASLLLGGAGTGAAVMFAESLPLVPGNHSWLLVPASLSTVLAGFILLVMRIKAITQVIGFLAFENGIFIFGLLLVNAVPFLVELGVLLDLLVAVFIMGIILNHISRTFSSLDTVRFSTLKDV